MLDMDMLLSSVSRLPNEILIHILSSLPTQDLLRITLVSQRFAGIAIYLLEQRLACAARLESRSLLLEAFHPAARFIEPPLSCSYLGTPGLDLPLPVSQLERPVHRPKHARLHSSLSVKSYDSFEEEGIPAWERLRQLYSFRSHFTPYKPTPAPGARPKHPAGDVPGSRTYQQPDADADDPTQLVSQRIYLDSSELFSQIRAVTTLVVPGPRRGLFEAVHGISDGVIRLWRHWLGDRCVPHRVDSAQSSPVSAKGKEKALVETQAERLYREALEAEQREDAKILWVNDGDNVGLKLRVHERRWNRPVNRRDIAAMRAPDDDVPVCYEIEYEEVLIRTRHLLLKFEESVVEQQAGKAMVMGTIFR